MLLLGPGAGEAYKSALNGKDGDFLDKRNDCAIVESKTFEVPGVDQPVDPLSREVRGLRPLGPRSLYCSLRVALTRGGVGGAPPR
jgi:hypothetical protein